jgi:hypothetical protein
LANILGIVPVAQQTLADPKDHRPVPLYERRKRSLILPRREALQELAIRSWIRVTYRSQLPQILHNYSGACLVHGFPFA